VSFQRHEERKNQLKALEWDRKQERLDRDSQRQEKRPDDGTRRAFAAGRNPDSLAVSVVSHLHLHPASPATASEGFDYKYEDEEEEVPAQNRAPLAPPHATSGATLLAMARPAKVHRGRNRHRRDYDYDYLSVLDGERFEIVEIDGRLVALDEDGWEILPDENAEASVSYSDIVRGNVR